MKLVKTAYGRVIPQDVTVPQKLEKLRDLPFPGGVDLQYIIRQLAQELDLNVLFDSESFRQDTKIKIELKNVTAAKALDYIFLQQGLFFQKVGPRTIMVGTSKSPTVFSAISFTHILSGKRRSDGSGENRAGGDSAATRQNSRQFRLLTNQPTASPSATQRKMFALLEI